MSVLRITPEISIPDHEIQVSAIRAQGSGGQNVNKVSSAVHLRFDIAASSLPERYKNRLLAMSDSRLTEGGEIVIKAQRFRSREKNLADARDRLREIVAAAGQVPRRRIATKPTRASKERRLDDKSKRSQLKKLRGPVE